MSDGGENRPPAGFARHPLTILALAVAGDWAAQGLLGTAYGIRPLILALTLALLWRARVALRSGVAALLVVAGGLVELSAGVAPAPVLVGALACAAGVGLAEALRRITRSVIRRGALALLALTPFLFPLGRWIADTESHPPLSIAVLSSVPLGPVADREGRNAPLMSALRTIGPVTLLDRMPSGGPGADRLLLLQPRRLDPDELVAIDGWVRAGGLALVLADPALGWAGDHPFGDPRNPLPVSLLDPLLEHWGVRLELADPSAAGDDPILSTPGFFTALTGGCELRHRATVALCRSGRGRALIVADADWLDPADWRAADRRPDQLARSLRSLSLPSGVGPLARWPWVLLLALVFAPWEHFRSGRRTGREQN